MGTLLKLAFGYCVAICLPQIHFETYGHHDQMHPLRPPLVVITWAVLLEVQVRLGQGEHTTAAPALPWSRGLKSPRWKTLQVSFCRRQIVAFGCYIFPPQTDPWWAQQIKLCCKLWYGSCDNFFFWTLECKRLTRVWFSNHRDNIFFLWAQWGGRDWRVSHSSLTSPDSFTFRGAQATGK